MSAEEESVETVRVAEEENKTEEPREAIQGAQHKVLFLTEDEAEQPSKVTTKTVLYPERS